MAHHCNFWARSVLVKSALIKLEKTAELIEQFAFIRSLARLFLESYFCAKNARLSSIEHWINTSSWLELSDYIITSVISAARKSKWSNRVFRKHIVSCHQLILCASGLNRFTLVHATHSFLKTGGFTFPQLSWWIEFHLKLSAFNEQKKTLFIWGWNDQKWRNHLIRILNFSLFREFGGQSGLNEKKNACKWLFCRLFDIFEKSSFAFFHIENNEVLLFQRFI